VNWALITRRPSSIRVTALLTVPLNRVVGREFVPNEDMGEWTVHMDAPEGTSLEGTSEIAFKLLEELRIEVAQIAVGCGLRHDRWLADASISARRPIGERRTRGRDHH
jgi:multidrug efflux pump subunit AcrB